MTKRTRRATANSTFAIGGVSCSADSLVVAETFVLHINICAKNPAHRKSAKRYNSLPRTTARQKRHDKSKTYRPDISSRTLLFQLQ